jgi:hypothetical protein
MPETSRLLSEGQGGGGGQGLAGLLRKIRQLCHQKFWTFLDMYGYILAEMK